MCDPLYLCGTSVVGSGRHDGALLMREDRNMPHHSEGHYADKHPEGRKMDPRIADAVRAEAGEGHVSCASAHKLAAELQTTPEVIGFHLDMAEARITKCQLGLFGYGEKKKIVKPAASVDGELAKALSGATAGGRLACSAAWGIADRFRMSRLEVACACEALGIRISPCQLGAF